MKKPNRKDYIGYPKEILISDLELYIDYLLENDCRDKLQHFVQILNDKMIHPENDSDLLLKELKNIGVSFFEDDVETGWVFKSKNKNSYIDSLFLFNEFVNANYEWFDSTSIGDIYIDKHTKKKVDKTEIFRQFVKNTDKNILLL